MVLWNNWGEEADGQQSEPDNFNGSQDALALSINGWPFGTSGEWNDIDETNRLYFIIEYNGSINDVGIGVGLGADAVRIFGEGYRPPEFEAKISQGRVDAIVLKRPGEGVLRFKPFFGRFILYWRRWKFKPYRTGN